MKKVVSKAEALHSHTDMPIFTPGGCSAHAMEEADDLRMRNALQVPKALLEKAFAEGWAWMGHGGKKV